MIERRNSLNWEAPITAGSRRSIISLSPATTIRSEWVGAICACGMTTKSPRSPASRRIRTPTWRSSRMSARVRLRIRISLGNEGRTAAGDVQVMSAVRACAMPSTIWKTRQHEYSKFGSSRPNEVGKPAWGAKPFPKADRSGRFVTLASGQRTTRRHCPSVPPPGDGCHHQGWRACDGRSRSRAARLPCARNRCRGGRRCAHRGARWRGDHEHCERRDRWDRRRGSRHG